MAKASRKNSSGRRNSERNNNSAARSGANAGAGSYANRAGTVLAEKQKRNTVTGMKLQRKVRSERPSAKHGERIAEQSILSAPEKKNLSDKKHSMHDATASSLDKDKTRKTCKKRPDSRKAQKGGGGSRDFVPWCKKS